MIITIRIPLAAIGPSVSSLKLPLFLIELDQQLPDEELLVIDLLVLRLRLPREELFPVKLSVEDEVIVRGDPAAGVNRLVIGHGLHHPGHHVRLDHLFFYFWPLGLRREVYERVGGGVGGGVDQRPIFSGLVHLFADDL